MQRDLDVPSKTCSIISLGLPRCGLCTLSRARGEATLEDEKLNIVAPPLIAAPPEDQLLSSCLRRDRTCQGESF